MAETLGVFDAKSRFSELIDRAERGEETVVTRHGKPVARVAPLEPGTRLREDIQSRLARWREWRDAQLAAHGPTSHDDILAWRDEGRR